MEPVVNEGFGWAAETFWTYAALGGDVLLAALRVSYLGRVWAVLLFVTLTIWILTLLRREVLS